MLHQIQPTVVFLFALTATSAFICPLTMTGLAQAFAPRPANGNCCERDGKLVGSELMLAACCEALPDAGGTQRSRSPPTSTGLGLAISRFFIEALHGAIAAVIRPGGWDAVLTITLPIAEVAGAEGVAA
jgi:hypothetical protein